VAEIEADLKLLDELERYPDASVVVFAAQEKNRLRVAIEAVRRRQTMNDRPRDERFE
jgi:hypothetical protein